jgi:hypothetical protein
MNYSLVEREGSGTATKRQKDFPSNEEVSVQELSRAVGQHALLQAEIDGKIASHIIAMRDDLRVAKEEIGSLRAQVDQLIHGLSQALQSTLSQRNRAPQSNPADRASLQSRSK